MQPSSLADLTRAAQRQQPGAINALAQALVRAGQPEDAFAWYSRSAAAGDALAQVEAGRMRAYGVGCEMDVGQARAHWELAERQGAAAARYLLATLAVGEQPLALAGTAQDRLQSAAAADYPPALRAIAIQRGRVAHPGGNGTASPCWNVRRQAAMPCRPHCWPSACCVASVPPQPDAAAQLLQQLQPLGMTALPAVDIAPPDPADDTADHRIAFAPRVGPVRRHTAPRIEEYAAVLSADECRLLMLLARPHLRASKVIDPNDASTQRAPIRTSRGATLDPIIEDFAARAAQARLAACAQLPLAHAEPLSVLCYAPGEQYRAHRDYLPPGTIAADRPTAGNRQRTVCVYLNDVGAGGDTEFPIAGVRVRPRPGTLVCFDNLHADGRPDADSLHAGLPVTAGSKWLGTLWFRQQRYRHW